MNTLVIGHRGTGKTSFLKRVELYFRESGLSINTVDLDAEIVRREGRSIDDIFRFSGEAAFREIETRTLNELSKTASSEAALWVSAGAGFSGAVPGGWRVLWLRRPSDKHGRVFTDRPRLDVALNAIEEYQMRFQKREPRFKKMADEILTLPEGLERPDEFERKLVLGQARASGAALTLTEDYFKTESSTRQILQARAAMNFSWFELRDDLLSNEQIEFALRELPTAKVLLSLRSRDRLEASLQIANQYQHDDRGLVLDWPSEWGEPPQGCEPRFVSFHARDIEKEDVLSYFRRVDEFAKPGRVLKVAITIKDFSELAVGDQWLLRDTQSRVFLPSSTDGRWAWYRLLRAPELQLDFVREGDGSSADQPLLLDWIRRSAVLQTSSQKNFAAVLGDPVEHSRTPIEQADFFQARGASVFAIRVTESEWQEALPILERLGLKWAAVTAPLKQLAFELCKKRSDEATRLRSVNTLIKTVSWTGTNTDLGGFRESLPAYIHDSHPSGTGVTAIWGGGGTLAMLQEVLPDAVAYSARTGLPRRDSTQIKNPQLVIWSIGRSRINAENSLFPPHEWRPNVVVDLNYSEDSPGREYALAVGARYISGHAMFRAQAELQRLFWMDARHEANCPLL